MPFAGISTPYISKKVDAIDIISKKVDMSSGIVENLVSSKGVGNPSFTAVFIYLDHSLISSFARQSLMGETPKTALPCLCAFA
jgi:hypothetical protein